MIHRTYGELQSLETFEERFDYLRIKGFVGSETFGHERWLNQRFYTSREWKAVRTQVIARDLGCDLGIPGREIMKKIHVHHMNPMVIPDLLDFNKDVLNPEYLISVSHETHNAIHYGSEAPKPIVFVERKAGDTKLW